MRNTRNKRRLAEIQDNFEEDRSQGSSRDKSSVDPNENYITQVSQEIEGRIAKKLSQEFSKRESRILGALAKLDHFLTNPSVDSSTPKIKHTSVTGDLDNSESDLHEREGHHLDGSRRRNYIPDPDEVVHMVTGAPHHDHMVTGMPNHDNTVTELNQQENESTEEVTFQSPGPSSGKQKKARSTSQPQFRSENTPATIEADQILLALQQIANNANRTHLEDNINRIAKLPKSLTTTMPTFDGKTEKFELFEDLFQTSLKIHNQLSEEHKINYFHSLMRGDALQTFKNITSPARENLEEILVIFRRKYVKPQSMATAKHKFQKLVFDPSKQKLVDFLDDLQRLAKDAFGDAAQAIIEQFIYAKMPPHLKKTINQAHLENGTYEQIVKHLERELELNGLEAADELPVNNINQQETTEAAKQKPTCYYCKKPGHHKSQCRKMKRDQKTANETGGKPESPANSDQKQKQKEKPKYPPCETCKKTNHTTDKCYFGANAANKPQPRNKKNDAQASTNRNNQNNPNSNNLDEKKDLNC